MDGGRRTLIQLPAKKINLDAQGIIRVGIALRFWVRPELGEPFSWGTLPPDGLTA